MNRKSIIADRLIERITKKRSTIKDKFLEKIMINQNNIHKFLEEIQPKIYNINEISSLRINSKFMFCLDFLKKIREKCNLIEINYKKLTDKLNKSLKIDEFEKEIKKFELFSDFFNRKLMILEENLTINEENLCKLKKQELIKKDYLKKIEKDNLKLAALNLKYLQEKNKLLRNNLLLFKEKNNEEETVFITNINEKKSRSLTKLKDLQKNTNIITTENSFFSSKKNIIFKRKFIMKFFEDFNGRLNIKKEERNNYFNDNLLKNTFNNNSRNQEKESKQIVNLVVENLKKKQKKKVRKNNTFSFEIIKKRENITCPWETFKKFNYIKICKILEENKIDFCQEIRNFIIKNRKINKKSPRRILFLQK